MDVADVEFDPVKSGKLRKERGLGFEEIIAYLENGCMIDSYPHPNRDKYPRQHVHSVQIEDYVWLLITEKRNDKHRFVTLYRSRKATRKRKGDSAHGT